METYNDEEKRLDREWYGMDEGQDEYQNAFSNISDEYIKVWFIFIICCHVICYILFAIVQYKIIVEVWIRYVF